MSSFEALYCVESAVAEHSLLPTTPHITLRNARLLLLQEILSLENMARRQYFLWKLCSFN